MDLKDRLVNKTRGTKMITTIINSGALTQENKSFILSILKFHPNAEEKQVDHISDIYIGQNFYRRACLMVKYDNYIPDDDISYAHCIANLFGKYNKDTKEGKQLNNALRQATKETAKYKNFRNAHTRLNSAGEWCGTCALCNCDTTNKDIDHDDPWPFLRIYDEFFKGRNINPKSVTITEYEPLKYRIDDENIRTSWVAFHDERCVYRLLCATCNRRIGSHGYRSSDSD